MCFDLSWNTSYLYNYDYHISSQWLPYPDQIDLSTTSESHMASQLAEHATMYYAYVVLREILDYFLLYHEIMADPRQKQHPEVLFMSKILPVQSESVYPCNLKP
jgi:hypothetical protein